MLSDKGFNNLKMVGKNCTIPVVVEGISVTAVVEGVISVVKTKQTENNFKAPEQEEHVSTKFPI